MMSRPVSSLWFSQPDDGIAGLERCIDAGCEAGSVGCPRSIFFRADDVGIPGKQFLRLMDLFIKYRVPLCLAVVPAWLTGQRWSQMKRIAGDIDDLWCWHQHGWRHLNHEGAGKKQEFGPSRSVVQSRTALMKGRSRLELLMEDRFYPAFTPPWNRCNLRTLELLNELGYHAVSRSYGSRPAPPAGLPDLAVNVDLHTRKEAGGATGRQNLFRELHQGLSSDLCGIMIHHRRMNDTAFGFLEDLLMLLTRRKDVDLVHFEDLIGKAGTQLRIDHRDG